jgi:HlyD family secretion protein
MPVTKPNTNDKQESSTSVNVDDLEEVVFTLQKDGTVKKLKIRTDIQDINYIEVLGGIPDSAVVVTSPYNVISKTLKDGMKVKVVPKGELFEEKK